MLTNSIINKIPKLHEGDCTAYVKFFTPWSDWTWYVCEFDGKDIFYGLVEGYEKEWRYFSLAELESIRGPFGLKIERDRHFKPTKVE